MDTRFTKIPKVLNEDSRIHPLDFAVYCALDYCADNNGLAWPGLSKIAELAHMSRPTVINSIRRLIECGYVHKEQRRKPNGKEFSSSLYILALRAESPQGVVSEVAGGSKPSRRGIAQNDEGVVSHVDGGSKGRLRGVVSHVDGNETHLTRPNERTPPYPPEGEPHHPPAACFEKLPSSEVSLSKTACLTTAEARAKNSKPKNRGAADGGAAKKAHGDRVDANFADFWAAYPRKDGEAGARREWRKLFPFGRSDKEHRATLGRVGERLGALLERIDRRELELRFVPRAQNWLKSEDWSHD
jgi:hypothetical protein